MRDIYHVVVSPVFMSKHKIHQFYIETDKGIDWMIDYIRECLRITLDKPKSEMFFDDITQGDISTYRLDVDERMSYIVTFLSVKLAVL